MCDQDHFEEDAKQFEALGLVTRKQFGMMLGAGVAMMLPQVANAVTVTEIGCQRDDARWHGGLLLRASGQRHSPGRPDVARHLRPAAGFPADGQAAGRIGLFGAGRESFLPRQEGPDRGERRRHADPDVDAAGARL